MGNKVNSFVVCLAALFTVTAFTVVPNKVEAPPVAEGPSIEGDEVRLSGEEFFRGLYFGRGDAVTIFMDLSFMRDVYQRMQQTNQPLVQGGVPIGLQMIKQIKQNHPHFFARFGQALCSGDRIAIKQALQRANKLLTRNMRVAENTQQRTGGENVIVLPPQQPIRIVAVVYLLPCPLEGCDSLPIETITQLQMDQLVNTISAFRQ